MVENEVDLKIKWRKVLGVWTR